MAYFIYNVHPVRDKVSYGQDRYRQGGPACWYYSAKMLLRFHDKLQPQMETQYAQWQALHVIRKFLGQKDFNRQKLDELKTDLQTRHAQLKTQEEREAKKKARSELSKWDRTLLERAPEAIQLVDRYQNLACLDSLEEMRRYGLFRAAFGTELFEPLPISSYPATARGLKKALKTYGPLYCGGGLSAKTLDDFEVPGDASSIAGEGFRAKSFSDDRHAIALIGINTDAKEAMVYYRDPNQMDMLGVMSAAQLFRQADPFRDGQGNDCLYLAVRCGGASASSSATTTGASASAGGCTHREATMVNLWENNW